MTSDAIYSQFKKRGPDLVRASFLTRSLIAYWFSVREALCSAITCLA